MGKVTAEALCWVFSYVLVMAASKHWTGPSRKSQTERKTRSSEHHPESKEHNGILARI